MIGLVVVTHGNLAVEMLKVLEHIVGPQEGIVSVSIEAEDDMEARRNDIEAAILEVDQGNGVIVLTDLFGGTPSNLAISMMHDESIEVIAGINLPLLVKLASVRKQSSITEAAAAAQEAGRKYIQVASSIINQS